MELEQLKMAWEDLSRKVEKQHKLTNQIIEKMTRQQYRSQLNKIAYPEITGTVICYAGAVLLGWSFKRLDQPLMQIFGILSLVYLVAAPIASLTLLAGLTKVQVSTMSYSEAVRDYIRKKIQFQKFQKLNVSPGFVFMIISFPVLLDLMGKDISEVPQAVWMCLLPCVVIFFFLATRWVLRNYNRALKEAEGLLAEIMEINRNGLSDESVH